MMKEIKVIFTTNSFYEHINYKPTDEIYPLREEKQTKLPLVQLQ